MAAFQGKCSKEIYTVEKHLKRTNRNESKDALINEYYRQFLLGEINSEKEEEKVLTSLQQAHEKINNPILMDRFLNLQEKVQAYEKQLATLKDHMDNLIIQSIAEQESFKIQQAEKGREIKSFYISEEKSFIEELGKVNRECARNEEEIGNQMSSDIAARNARLYEIKGNLQKQIIDKNNDYTIAQNEGRDLRKQLEELKSNMKQNGTINDYRRNRNIMQFQSNISAPKEDQFSLPNIPDSKEISTQKSTRCLFDSVKESSKHKENDKERSRLADEYEEFERNFKLSSPPTAKPINQKMKPNPCSIVANRDKELQVKSHDYPKINKTEPYTTDDLLDESNFLGVMDNIDSIDNSAGNAPRKLPTVYMGNAKKKNRTGYLNNTSRTRIAR